jgi:hypothetical protein
MPLASTIGTEFSICIIEITQHLQFDVVLAALDRTHLGLMQLFTNRKLSLPQPLTSIPWNFRLPPVKSLNPCPVLSMATPRKIAVMLNTRILNYEDVDTYLAESGGSEVFLVRLGQKGDSRQVTSQKRTDLRKHLADLVRDSLTTNSSSTPSNRYHPATAYGVPSEICQSKISSKKDLLAAIDPISADVTCDISTLLQSYTLFELVPTRAAKNFSWSLYLPERLLRRGCFDLFDGAPANYRISYDDFMMYLGRGASGLHHDRYGSWALLVNIGFPNAFVYEL